MSDPENILKRKSNIDKRKQLHNFPTQLTTFIGRTEEITAIGKLLEDPACRLLTITGLGGIGKTRLAIESALKSVEYFAQGAYFISLQSLRTGESLSQAIVDALPFSLSGGETPQTQLLNYLQDKEILLVMDNFEQLLSRTHIAGEEIKEDSATLLNGILQETVGPKLLITSREILNLQSEWVYAIEGMVYPRSAQVENIESYSAVQLFVERAQRIRQGFLLRDEQENVVKICQLVEGMPLGLELLASWIKSLECAEIVEELHQNLNLLATSLRDIPDRHQNMRAVFNHSWKLLGQDEQATFKRLSVFRGGFQRAAAEEVAGATLPILSKLSDKSLLRKDASGRYQIHELLRQYGEEQLHRSVEESIITHDSHSVFYANFLNAKLNEILVGKQLEASAGISAELENVRAAWHWAVEHAKVEEIHKSVGALLYLFQYQSRYYEGVNLYQDAIRCLESISSEKMKDLTLAELLDAQGWLYLRLGQLDQAREVLEKSLVIYEHLAIPPAPRMGTEPRTALGVLANILGDYDKATSLGDEAYQLSEAQANKWNMMFALYVLTNASLAKGDILEAREYAQRAYSLAIDVNDSWFRAFILNDLGSTSITLGEHARAQEYFQASYSIRKEFNDPGGMAEALTHLGKISVLQEEYAEARKSFQESLSMYREINDRGGVATAMEGLGVIAREYGDFQSAGKFFQNAIQIATEIQYQPLIISIAINAGKLFILIGQFERSVELLTLILNSPAISGEAKKKTEDLLSRCWVKVHADVFEAAEKRGQAPVGEEALRMLLAEPILFVQSAWETENVRPESQELIEPLTTRELNVLQLIAEGLSNKIIAERLVITLGTVKWYNNQIFNKLNVKNRTQAVARARELNLLS